MDNPWKRGALSFLMCNSLSFLFFYGTFDGAGLADDIIGELFICNFFLCFGLFIIGLAPYRINRVKFFVAILGTFGIFPICIFFIMPFLTFLVLSNFSFFMKILLIMLYAGFSIAWCIHVIIQTKCTEKKFSYLGNCVIIKNDIAYIDRDRVRDFSRLEKHKKMSGSLTKILSMVLPTVYIGYPLQRVIVDMSGQVGLMAFLAVLSIPMSLYVMGRMSAGYYLWIYLVGKLEEKIGAKIFLSGFDESDNAKR